MQTPDHRRVLFGNAVSERLSPIRGRNVRSVEQVLAAPWNAVQRAAIFPRSNLLVGLLCLPERQVFRQRNHATQFRIKLLQPRKVDLREPLGSELTLFYPPGQPRYRSERNVFIARRQRARISFAPDKLIAGRAAFLSRQDRVPQRIRSEGRLKI